MGANAQTSVPTFTAGEVLTAANMNISARTGIPVFATTVTRDAAFGGTGEKTLAEGQFAYLEDSNTTQYYDGAAWQSVNNFTFAAWTPTLTNITQGNGTLVARYGQIGKLVVGYFVLTFGSTTSITGTPQISYPVTMSTSYPATVDQPQGIANFQDTGTALYSGVVNAYRNNGTWFLYPWNASGTYLGQSNLSSTVPFTWTTNDVISFTFCYEAA